jgi:hypothetical protein
LPGAAGNWNQFSYPKEILMAQIVSILGLILVLAVALIALPRGRGVIMA